MEYTFYKLDIGNKCYVGSTIDFPNRIQKHSTRYKCETSKEYNLKIYQCMRQNGGWEKVKVMIIDKIIYNNKDEARQMETKFMLNFNAELNDRYPKRSNHEYYEANKENILEYHKKYREENKEAIAIKDKERHKIHYEKNREKISEIRKEKIACDLCGKMMRKDSIYKHKKSIH